MDDIERLSELAEAVPDSYPDFVLGLRVFSVKDGTVAEMIRFMEDNPKASTSEIIEYQESIEP